MVYGVEDRKQCSSGNTALFLCQTAMGNGKIRLGCRGGNKNTTMYELGILFNWDEQKQESCEY